MTETVLVTGGAGFIGGNFVRHWFRKELGALVNLDKLTYAGNLQSLASLAEHPGYTFIHGDICDAALVSELLAQHHPKAIIHFAAESHVDRSILAPEAFLHTNINGTYTLLQAARAYLATQTQADAQRFRFLHVSTDEVYGSLAPEDPAFSERTPYAPNSPYAASKAASDLLVRAWAHTYKLPVLVTNCSNNYGPYQFPEKLIPLMILSALGGKPLPVYGDGSQVRDWLFVEDHCEAIVAVLQQGRPGETYNIGGNNQRTNLEVVHALCALLDELAPDSPHRPHARLIASVQDRPGHDARYAIDAAKITQELGWQRTETFESGLRKTVLWYLTHPEWVEGVTSGAYHTWLQTHYGQHPAEAGVA